MSATEDLRELAREHPDEFRRVAERYGGAIEARMLRLLDDSNAA